MRQIRRNIFETNSSSVHSITMCMKSDFDKWVSGELVWDKWNDKLIPITPEVKEKMESEEYRYYTYDQFNDWDYIAFETFEDKFKTTSGDEVVAFGYYGHD